MLHLWFQQAKPNWHELFCKPFDSIFTGGGAGSGMIYMAGKQDHKVSNKDMIEHIVQLVENRVLEIEKKSIQD